MLQLLATYSAIYNGKARFFRVVEIINARTVRVELLDRSTYSTTGYRTFTLAKLENIVRSGGNVR